MPPKQNLAPPLVIHHQNTSQGHTPGFRSIVFKFSRMFCFICRHHLSKVLVSYSRVVLLWDLGAKRHFEVDRQQLNSTYSNYKPVTGRLIYSCGWMNFLWEPSEAAELQQDWGQPNLGRASSVLSGLGEFFNYKADNVVSQLTSTVGQEIPPQDFFRYSKVTPTPHPALPLQFSADWLKLMPLVRVNWNYSIPWKPSTWWSVFLTSSLKPFQMLQCSGSYQGVCISTGSTIYPLTRTSQLVLKSYKLSAER